MDSYDSESKVILATAGELNQDGDKSKQVASLSSEPLDRYILELRSDLRNELKGITSIKWQ